MHSTITKADISSVDFESEDGPVTGIACDKAILFLNHIPGRNAHYRLHRYAEVLIEYLNLKPDAINNISRAHQFTETDNASSNLTIDAILDLQNKMLMFEEMENKIRKVQYDNIRMASEIIAGVGPEQMDWVVKRLDNCDSISNKLHLQMNDALISSRAVDINAVNARKRDIIFSEMEHGSRIGDVQWSSIIRNLGYDEKDWSKLYKCGRIGLQRKRERGDAIRRTDPNSNKKRKIIYDKNDVPMMEDIVRSVYSVDALTIS